jgi:hypothetical protein
MPQQRSDTDRRPTTIERRSAAMVTWNATAECLSRPRHDWGVDRSEANERTGRRAERLRAIDWLFASDAAVEIAVAEVKATA